MIKENANQDHSFSPSVSLRAESRRREGGGVTTMEDKKVTPLYSLRLQIDRDVQERKQLLVLQGYYLKSKQLINELETRLMSINEAKKSDR
jgi:hypothetical protein